MCEIHRLRVGQYAVGYVMSRGRVSGIITGAPGSVRSALGSWGPA